MGGQYIVDRVGPAILRLGIVCVILHRHLCVVSWSGSGQGHVLPGALGVVIHEHRSRPRRPEALLDLIESCLVQRGLRCREGQLTLR